MSFGFSEIRRAKNSDKNSDSSDVSGIPSGLATGAILRERREAMGVTLEEAEASIRIRQKYLSAMESDEWHLLPGEIVGRGFLRNYAAYLDLEPSEMLDRRRSAIEPRVAAALRSTSAGAPLPPVREVNYDPKELDLKDEPEGIEGTTINFRGLIPILVLGLLAFVIWQGFDLIQGAASNIGSGIQARIEAIQENSAPTVSDSGIRAEENPPAENSGDMPTGDVAINEPESPSNVSDLLVVDGSNTAGGNGTGGDNSGGNTNEPAANAQEAPAVVPTNTPEAPTPEPPTPEPPTPEPPTPTPEPPTPIPEPPTPEPPTPEPPTPEPPAPVVAAPSCPDPRSLISAPGQNQIAAGPLEIVGSATHETFDYYKLEYAPGDGSGGQWAYFDGAQNQVVQGRLGTLDTASLANGTYTIRVVVVDLTANFPPPCQVTISIQN